MSELRQFAQAACFLQLSRIVRQVVFVYCKYSFFSESMKAFGSKAGWWGNGGAPPYLINQKVSCQLLF